MTKEEAKAKLRKAESDLRMAKVVLKMQEQGVQEIECKIERLQEIINKQPEVTFEEIIEQAQKEAYNQAIDDAVMNAEAKVKVWYDFGTGYYQQSDVIVDKDSILKLKK